MPGSRQTFAVVSCGTCPRTTTSDFGHVHHVVPKAAGGERGPTIWLCAECHGLVHRIAEAILGNRLTRCLDQIAIVQPDGRTQAKLLALAERVAAAMKDAQEGVNGPDPEDRVNVSFRISRAYHEAAGRALAGLTDPHTGRAVGVPGMARQLLLAWLQDRGAIG